MPRKSSGWGGSRPGAGRPTESPSGQKRDRRITLNFTREELAALERAAGDRSLTAFTRDLVLKHLARRRR